MQLLPITYSNQYRYDSLDFSTYLKHKSFSHSYLKGENNGIAKEIIITEKIQRGKLVDQILTNPSKADMRSELYPLCRDIAAEVRGTFPYIDHFDKQVAFIGDATCGEFTMPVKGMLDYLFVGKSVIDLKITEAKIKDVPALINFMGYENQLFHYGKLSSVDNGFLMIYSVPDKRSILRMFDLSGTTNEFWQDKIMKFGKVSINN